FPETLRGRTGKSRAGNFVRRVSEIAGLRVAGKRSRITKRDGIRGRARPKRQDQRERIAGGSAAAGGAATGGTSQQRRRPKSRRPRAQRHHPGARPMSRQQEESRASPGYSAPDALQQDEALRDRALINFDFRISNFE